MRPALVSLALLSLAASACQTDQLDVNLSWDFGASHQSCSAAGVANIEVDIGGDFGSPLILPCDGTGGSGEVNFGMLDEGSYEIVVTGYDASGDPIYQDDSVYDVDQDADDDLEASQQYVQVEPFITTAPSGQGSLLLYVATGGSCLQSGITSLIITIDGAPAADVVDGSSSPTFFCSDDGADEIDGLAAGSHSVEVDGYVGTALTYSSSFTADIVPGRDTQLDVDLAAVPLAPATSTLLLSWTFAGMSCAAAEVDTVHIFVDGTDTATLPCIAASGVPGGELTGLSGGAHAIGLWGIRGTGAATELTYQTSGSGPSLQLAAGGASHAIIDAPAIAPGTGGATLTFAFPAGGPDCTNTSASTQISYTLTSPAGVSMPPATAICGGASGNTSIAICDPAAAGCAAGNSGLAAGIWTLRASATSGGNRYSGAGPFAVPSGAAASATLAFTRP